MSPAHHSYIKGARAYRPFPVILRPDNEAEGEAILRESPNATGVLLFGALRDTMLWLTMPDEDLRRANQHAWDRSVRWNTLGTVRRHRRSGRNIHPAFVESALLEPLRILARFGATPNSVPISEVAAACRAVADWASNQYRPNTELAFAQAVALAEPDNPAHALRTARLARDLAQFPRADSWFRATIKGARRQKNWRIYVDAYLGLSTFYIRSGNLPAARVVVQRALQGARRWRFRDLEGVAHQDLFHICAETGEIRKAYNHAESARTAYGEAEEYLGRLAADLANFWIHLGRFSRALPIYEALVTRPFWDQTARAFLAASLVRASALVQSRDKYEQARAYAMEVVPRSLIPSILVECYVLIAAGDLAMKEWDRARETATFALRRAHVIGAIEMEFRAEAIRDLSQRQIAPPDGSVTLKFEPSIETPGLERIADSLARELVVAVDP